MKPWFVWTALIAITAPAARAEPPSAVEIIDPPEIVVTARPGARKADPDAVDALRAFCFDPARRRGRPEEPASMSRWLSLDEAERRQFKINDAATPAYGLSDGVRQHELWLKIERLERPGSLVEHRCTMLVIGGVDHDRLIGAMNRLFHGTPTQRHVGHPAGTPRVPGWRQYLWSGMPQRGSASWRSIAPSRGAGGQSWVVVTGPGFYADHDYIYGDLKIRGGRQLVSMITFAVVRKSG